MKQSTNIARNLGLTALLAVGLGLSTQVNAASACKGLQADKCDAAQSCSWVNGYERSDGRKVTAFCRTKAKRSAAKAVSQSPTKAKAQQDS